METVYIRHVVTVVTALVMMLLSKSKVRLSLALNANFILELGMWTFLFAICNMHK